MVFKLIRVRGPVMVVPSIIVRPNLSTLILINPEIR